jgi:hypothetical protein
MISFTVVTTKIVSWVKILFVGASVADPDPGSVPFLPLDRGLRWGKNQDPDPG